MKKRILVINPGSTSTKAVLFENGTPARSLEIDHSSGGGGASSAPPRVMDQLGPRMDALRRELGEPGRLQAVVGRGGFLAPMPGGVYRIGQAMLDELAVARHGEHASNLGAFMARAFAMEQPGAHGDMPACPALVVDPVVTDELMDQARLTGLPGVSRRSIFHALSQRAAAREAAGRLGLSYERGRFIVAHLGGGISVGAHLQGRVVDVTNALDGEGPFSPERSGQLPLLPVLQLLENGVYTPAGLRAILTTRAGLAAHLGSPDLRLAQERMNAGDAKARIVFEAMAYAVAKAVASMAPALEGRVEAVVLTGGMARSTRLVHEITRRAAFLGPVVVVAGLHEMEAMERGAALALDGKLPIKDYPPHLPEKGEQERAEPRTAGSPLCD
jgi:butyrate kinase